MDQNSADRLVDLRSLGQGNPNFDYALTSVSQEEGEFLASLIRRHGYSRTIEIGCALGLSSFYICEALASFDSPSHTIIDPFQTTNWKSVGIENLKRSGFNFFRLIEERSEFALPKLLEAKAEFDMAFIDGMHTFDHCLLDFFYLNRLVRVGGTIVFDDADWPAVHKVVNYVKHYPHYRLVSPTSIRATKETQIPDILRGRASSALHHGAGVLPERLRDRIRSSRLLRQKGSIATQRWVAFEKTAPDSRKYDWYHPF